MENTLREFGENAIGVEGKIPTKNYYSKDTGLNVEFPITTNSIDRRIRYNELNRAISQEDRANYLGKVIPIAEQERILKSYTPPKKEEGGFWSDLFSEGVKSSINTAQNIFTAPYRGLTTLGATAGTSVAEARAKAQGLPVKEGDKEKAVLEAYESVNPDYEETQFELKEAPIGSGAWVGQGLGNVAFPLVTGLATGNVVPLSAAFGFSSYADTTKTLLENDKSLMEANVKGIASGSLETALEMMTISRLATKVGMPRLQRYATRFVVGSGQEVAQSTKDMLILGDADKRTIEQKRDELISALVFGGIGEIVGLGLRDASTRKAQKQIQQSAKKEGMSDELAKEVALTATLDEKPDYDRLNKQLKEEINKRQDIRRGEVYEAFIEQGDSPEVAGAKAQELIPSVEEVESEIIEDLRKGTFISEEEKQSLKEAYEEAIKFGEEAGVYLATNEELKNLIASKGGKSEAEAKEYASYYTGMMIKDYQALKDNGFEGNFNDVKDKFYKLNGIINYDVTEPSVDEQEEIWAEYEARNNELSDEEKEFFVEKPSHKLYSVKEEGNDFVEYRGNPEGAIDKLLSEKNGFVSGAIFKDEIGDIDFIYGKTGKDGYGLAHIIERREQEGINGVEFVKTIPEIIRRGSVYRRINQEGRAFILSEDREVMIRLDWDGRERNWLLTAYMKKSGALPLGLTSGQNRLDEQTTSSNSAMEDSVTPSNKNVNGKLNSIVFVSGEEVEAFDDVYTSEGKRINYSNEGNYYDTGLNREARRGRDNTAIVKMSPQEFLELTPKGMGSRDVSKLEEVINNGEEIAMPFLEVEILDKENKILSITGHEGRHRSLAMSNLGVNNGYVILDSRDFYRNKELFGDLSEWKILAQNETDISKAIPLSENVFPKSVKLNSTSSTVIGAYDEITREVELFKGQNPSTLMHELSHHFLLNHLNLMETMGLQDRNRAVFDFLAEKGGHDINSVSDLTKADKENLTEAFITYMNTGIAPNLVTKNIFQRAKEWMIDAYNIHKTDASPEIRDYFDNLISQEGAIPDVSELSNRIGEVKEILRQAQNGEQVSFKGLGKKELQELQKVLHTRVRRKGLSLRDEIIASGGIKEGTELAKALGFDVLKRDKMYTTKENAIGKEDELIEWLAERGFITPVQEGEDYSATEKRWEEVQKLIDNAENIYSEREQRINEEREVAIRNQANAQEIVDDLLKDNTLGLKDINDLDNLLTRVVSKVDDVDITKVNTKAVKYVGQKIKDLNRDVRDMLRRKDLSFKNKREEQYQAQNDLKDFIRNLPINGKHKISLMGNIQRVKDYESLAKIVEDLKPRIKGFMEQEAKHLMRNSIDHIVRSSKPTERKKQKFNYEYNKFFEELREINKLTQEQATDKLQEIFDMVGEDAPFDERDILINKFLSYKSRGMDSSLELMRELSETLDAIYNEAINDRMDTLERLGKEREDKINEAVSYIENTKAVGKVNQKLLKMTNLNSNLSELFGKKWANAHKMDSLLIKQDMETNKILDDTVRDGKEIYGLKKREDFVELMNDMRVQKEEYTLNNYRDDMTEQLSKMQLLDIYLTIKNKSSQEAYRKLYEDYDELGNQTTTQIEDLLSNLTEEDKKFADMLQRKVNELYDAENKVYVKLYGIDMPKHENYWMRTSERAERPLMDVKQFMNLEMLPSFMKERSKAPHVTPGDAFKKFARRIHDSKYMTEVFEDYKELYDLVHSNRVKKAILKKYDDNRYKVLNQSLKRVSLGGVNDGYNELNSVLGKAISNWVVSKISFSETVLVKQLASFTNYMENVPVGEFMKYEAEFISNPKKAIEFMKEFAGEYLDHRFKAGIQNEVLQRIMNAKPEEYSRMTGAYQKYLNAITWPVRFGDVGAIYLGGYARAKYLIEQGVPLEKARRMFIEETESAQQSGNKAELSEFQQNPLWRVFTAFKNTNLQYMRKMQDSYIQYTRGEIDAKQLGKIWGNYMVIQSVLYQVLTNIGTWWRDDDEEDLNIFKDVWMRILTSPIAGFPIIGDITEGVFAENYWGLNVSGKQDMEAFIGGARDVLDGEYDAKKISKGTIALASFFKPLPDRIIKGVINLLEE